MAVNDVFSPQKLLTMDHHPRASDTPLSSLSRLAVGAQHFQSSFSLPIEVSKPGLYCKGVIPVFSLWLTFAVGGGKWCRHADTVRM